MMTQSSLLCHCHTIATDSSFLPVTGQLCSKIYNVLGPEGTSVNKNQNPSLHEVHILVEEERGNTKILSKFYGRKSRLNALGVSRGLVDTGEGQPR